MVCPFTFFAGPVIGYDEFYRGYRPAPPDVEDVVYAARKSAWGLLQLFVAAPWLQASVLALRRAAVAGTGAAELFDPRAVMWLWLAGMSVLLYIIYKGYTDVMLGLSRLAGFHLHEQFWFTLFAKDPAEYWRNGNRGVYRITSQYIFNRMFDKTRIEPKAVLATGSSGVVHSLMCPGVTPAAAVLLGALFGMTGLVVALLERARSTRAARLLDWGREGTAHNALVVAGVTLTFGLLAFPRSGFLLLVEGLSPSQWLHLVKLLFVRA
jgi:D-alanyl-lipoteichoic acid acyltransferase DltB (MBOAT superfamily)